jgi:serine phosphatase RsbU (regulator of sigma subunit)/anti-sigma regulatory factor (Ser/Thr protein kinase)
MTTSDVDANGGDRGREKPTRSAATRYGVALVSTLGSILIAVGMLSSSQTPVYSLLVGAVAISVWFGGLGPGLLAVGTGWTLSLFLFVGPGGHPEEATASDLLRWGIPLLVALAVVWIGIRMRLGRERAVVAVGEAEAAVRDLEAIQLVAKELSAALTPSHVARVLVQRTPSLVGARGGSVGIVEGNEVVVVDPAGVSGQTHPPGSRLSLDARAPIARAARDGEPVVVHDRRTFERSFPDGVALTPYVQAAIAVPIFVAGDTVGAMSLLFDRPGLVDADREAIAGIVADLGGQALERARLYERELQTSQALDRILRAAPRFHADSSEGAAPAICREARVTFGADLAALWQLDEDRMALVTSDPVVGALQPGLEASLEDFPGLLDSVGNLEASFVPDIGEEARGAGLARVRQLGVRSSLRAPIVVGDHADMVLTISWETVVTEPDSSTFLLVRRFTDQAGLALEQLERQRAEDEARRRATATRRLQEVTAALSQATTAADVGATCLEHALAFLQAAGGILGLVRDDGDVVELIGWRGYEDDEVARLGSVLLDSDLPLGAAIRTDAAVWALDEPAISTYARVRDDAQADPDMGSVAVPFRAGRTMRGALQLSFRQLRQLDEHEQEWLLALVTQCAQALERGRLFDDEQQLRRRSERLQRMTAALSGSLTRVDVATVSVDEMRDAVGADGVAIIALEEDGRVSGTLASLGYTDEVASSWLDAAAGSHSIRRLARRASTFCGTLDELGAAFPELEANAAESRHRTFLLAPLVAGRDPSGLVLASWGEAVTLANEDRAFFETLVSQTAQAIDRARQFESERTIAETLQRSVLPASLPRVAGVQLAARYLPGTAELDVGGDWFDAIQMSDGKVGLVVGDVVGKGVHAAATMAQLRNGLRAFSLDQTKPSSTIARLNRLADEILETSFATVVYLVVDPDAGICRFTSAGHPPPLVTYADGRVELLEGGRGLPLGVGLDSNYGQDTIEVPHGAVLLLYSDGLIERRNRSIDTGLELLCDALTDAPRDPEGLLEHVLEKLVGDSKREDDIAVLAVRVLAVAPRPLHLRAPSDIGSLALVRDSLRTWLESAPLTPRDAEDVVLATWEACANAIEHALDPRESHIEVFAEVDDVAVRIRVEDSGRWATPTDRVDRGLGLQLMESAASAVRVDRHATGTSVSIEKAVSVGHD